MLKKTLASLAALVASSPAAFAGPYVNYESNFSFAGSDYTSSIHEFHVGYEASTDYASFYGQLGPAILSPDGGEHDVVLSGKAGASAPLSSALSAYGEVAFITGEGDTGYGVKGGLKYSF